MKKSMRKYPETQLAAGIKAATLVVLLGLIAVFTQPAMDGAPVATETATAAVTQTTPTDYFPSHYPAPSTTVEQSPTF